MLDGYHVLLVMVCQGLKKNWGSDSNSLKKQYCISITFKPKLVTYTKPCVDSKAYQWYVTTNVKVQILLLRFYIVFQMLNYHYKIIQNNFLLQLVNSTLQKTISYFSLCLSCLL